MSFPNIAIEQVPVGSSKDQVLIALGSPSTTENFGGEAFYYISQTRKQSVAFMPEKVVGQRVVAVYFDKNDTVIRVADYGLKDGKVFDFVEPDHADRRQGRELPQPGPRRRRRRPRRRRPLRQRVVGQATRFFSARFWKRGDHESLRFYTM